MIQNWKHADKVLMRKIAAILCACGMVAGLVCWTVNLTDNPAELHGLWPFYALCGAFIFIVLLRYIVIVAYAYPVCTNDWDTARGQYSKGLEPDYGGAIGLTIGISVVALFASLIYVPITTSIMGWPRTDRIELWNFGPIFATHAVNCIRCFIVTRGK